MAWFKIDDGMHRSRKVLAIPRRHRLGAVGLFTMAGSWCADEETDGVFPDFMIGEWGGTQALVDSLIKVGLWTNVARSSDERSTNERRVLDEQATGTRFTKWGEYQPTRAELLEKRAKSAEKLRNWRARNQGGNPVSNQVTDPVTPRVTNPVSNPAPIPSHPIPTNKSSSSDSADAEPRPDVDEILDHLDVVIARTDPDARLPKRNKANRDAARLLLDLDGRTVEQVKAAATFALGDEFWRGNIRSMSKLREKYDQLRAQAQRKHPHAAQQRDPYANLKVVGRDD